MSDLPKAIAGLAVFLVLLTFPIWYMFAAPDGVVPPDRTRTEGGPRCIADDMVAVHMDLLNTWRDEVVRGDGLPQIYESTVEGNSKPYEKSLTKTCMKCHHRETENNGAPGCRQCHDYANVAPTCWECHLESDTKGGN